MKIFLRSSNQPDARNARLTIGRWIEAESPSGTGNYQVVTWDDPSIFRPGDTRFSSLIKVGAELGGAIILLGPNDSVQERENLWIQYAVLVGALGQYRTIICRYGNTSLASDMAGINHIVWEAGKDQTARGAISAWLKSLDELTPEELRKGAELKLDEQEIVLLTFMHERKHTHGYTTEQMAEQHIIGRVITRANFVKILKGLIDKKLIRLEMINDIKTYFVTETGERFVLNNPKLFAKNTPELGPIDRENGELGAKV